MPMLRSIALLLLCTRHVDGFAVPPNGRPERLLPTAVSDGAGGRYGPSIGRPNVREKSLPSLFSANLDSVDKDTVQVSPSTTDVEYELEDTGYAAYQQQPPHAGRHFLPFHPHFRRPQSKRQRIRSFFRFGSRRHKQDGIRYNRAPSSRHAQNKRFMEGWYYRITIPEEDASFAFIFSIEDPGRKVKGDTKKFNLVAAQVMGPNDEYLVQADTDDTKLWAYESRQALGCTFEWKEGMSVASNASGDGDGDDDNDDDASAAVPALHPDEWSKRVKTGFQMLPNRLQGRMQGNDGTMGGVFDGVPGYCDFDLRITPVAGWGDDERQYSTAGWLASYSAFEPHWQVTMADGRATGSVTWKDRRYEVEDVPFYAEKNWGGAFPSKWYWVQCNCFQDVGSGLRYDGKSLPPLAVTAGGGRRKIPFALFGSNTEDLGMVSVHYNGTFYEAVPWTGSMEWDVSPWGRWKLTGRCTDAKNRLFEAEVVATCSDEAGVVLRAPTQDEGMVYFCKDSFLANTTLSLWELRYDEATERYERGASIVEGAVSSQGGVEVGGGPWWTAWKARSKMKRSVKFLVRLPYRFLRRDRRG